MSIEKLNMRLFSFFTLLLLLIGTAMAEDWITKKSPYSVQQTVSQFTKAAEGAGANVFAVVDHQKGAKAVGAELAPSTLIIFGNPQIGTPVMLSNIRAGLDLPLKVLVFEENGETIIGYLKPETLKDRYDVNGVDSIFEKMSGALNKLTDAAIQ